MAKTLVEVDEEQLTAAQQVLRTAPQPACLRMAP
jgi:hypothetical protein